MIKFLTKLAKDLKEDLWLMESMTFSNRFEELENEKQTWQVYKLGETYLMMRHVEHAISSIERIQKYCLSEINGTFYDDYYKEWEGTDCESKYTATSPYEYIFGIWDNLPTPEMNKDISDFIEKHCDLGNVMMGGLAKFFPGIVPHKQNSEGEMEPVSILDCQIDDNLKAGSMLADLEDYNERLLEIRKIAFCKGNEGNLGDILNLISR